MKGTAFIILLMLVVLPLAAGQERVLFRDEFTDLKNWRSFSFEKIERHTSYKASKEDGLTALKAESSDSASALIYEKTYNVYDFPRVRWRWKVSNVYQRGDAEKKEGDDYPLRIYVMFKFDPQKAGFWEKIKYESIKLLYGEYPPYSTLNYIWANRPHNREVLTNTYTDRAKMIPLQTGSHRVGGWLTEEVDILSDYEKAFGEKPPKIATLAIMNDSDNTGESSVSFLDFIEVYR
jgi:hypothetical protein